MAKRASQLVIGIDLGGTNMQIGVVDAQHRVLGRAKKKTRASEGGDRVLERLVDGVHEACAAAGVSIRELKAVGIGAPGAIDSRTGTVLEAPNLRWRNYPLSKVLTRKLGHHAVVDNDVRAAIYGEWKLGAGRGVDDLLGCWIGTGLGGGFILGGRLYHGFFNTAGEIGHMTLYPGAQPAGMSVEDVCSRTAIVNRLLRLMATNHPSIIPELADGDVSDIKARIVAQAYQRGDKITKRVIQSAAEALGVGLANLVTALSLPRIVVGGGLTEAMGESLVSLIRDSVRAHALPEVTKKVEVVATRLEADAGLLGAALLAQEYVQKKVTRGR
jgi:glucokinase